MYPWLPSFLGRKTEKYKTLAFPREKQWELWNKWVSLRYFVHVEFCFYHYVCYVFLKM